MSTPFEVTSHLVHYRLDNGKIAPPLNLPPDGVLRIGRSPECHVTLTKRGTSRLHATLEWQDNSWVLHDRSLNGTRLRRYQDADDGTAFVEVTVKQRERYHTGDAILMEGHELVFLILPTPGTALSVTSPAGHVFELREATETEYEVAVTLRRREGRTALSPLEIKPQPALLLWLLIDARQRRQPDGWLTDDEEQEATAAVYVKDGRHQARSSLKHWWEGAVKKHPEIEILLDPNRGPRARGIWESKHRVIRLVLTDCTLRKPHRKPRLRRRRGEI